MPAIHQGIGQELSLGRVELGVEPVLFRLCTDFEIPDMGVARLESQGDVGGGEIPSIVTGLGWIMGI